MNKEAVHTTLYNHVKVSNGSKGAIPNRVFKYLLLAVINDNHRFKDRVLQKYTLIEDQQNLIEYYAQHKPKHLIYDKNKIPQRDPVGKE